MMTYYNLAESFREADYLQKLIAELEKDFNASKALGNHQLLTNEINRIKTVAGRDILIFGKHAEIYISVQTRLILNLDLRLIDFLRTLKARYSLAYEQSELISNCERLHDELLRLVCFYEQLIDTMIK